MSSKLRSNTVLIADTIRAHRWGMIAWIVGSAVAMCAIAAGFRSEVSRFPGGAEAMAESMRAGAQAMRLLRWPPERLDTLGGYLTYHNITLLVLFLTLYAAMKGVGAVRGAEAGHVVEAIIATGHSRARVVRDRGAGFAAVLALLGIGLGLGFAVAMALGGQSDPVGSLLSGFACAACAFVGYGIGALAGQLGGTARSSSAGAGLAVVAAYLYTNVWDRLGPFAAFRFVSPFYYFNRGRALVPGAGFDVFAMAGLVIAGAGLLLAAAELFERRDIGSPLWAHRMRRVGPIGRVQRRSLAALWSASLVRERTALLVWAGAAAAGTGLMAWLEPEVIDMWDKFDITDRMLRVDPNFTASDQYMSFVSEVIAPIVAAFVVTQVSGWAADREQGRLAMLLSTPLSWPALIRQRMLALLVGAAVVIAAAIGGLVAGSLIVGVEVSALGLARVAGAVLLLALGTGAVASWLVVLFSRAAVAALAAALGASYLLVLLVPLFDWPSWCTRLSLFGALGHPYLRNPAAGGLGFLMGLAVVGFLLARATTSRAASAA